MEGSAAAVCEILRCLIIHWKYETGISKGAFLEGQLVISIEALNSKHQPNSLHCIITIASVGSVYGGFILKKFLQEIQPVLPRFFTKLTWTSEEGGCSRDTSGVTPFQMSFEVDEKPRSLTTDCLAIKHFLHKIIIVHHKIRVNFSVTINGILSTEIFGTENEPTLSLWSGIALVVCAQHYVSKPKSSTTEPHCNRLHPVLGHPVVLFLPDDVAGMDLMGQLTLTPVAVLCPSPKVFSSQRNRLSSVSIFLYGPLGLPLILSDKEQPSAAVFRDPSYFIDWKKYHLYMVPNLDLSLDQDLVLPDAHYLVESSEGNRSQNMDPQGPALLLFLFVDFYSGFPVQQMEVLGIYTVLATHLSAILTESQSAVRDSIQSTVDRVLTQHQQAAKAADTQEFGVKLHKIFHNITQHRFPHHGSCNTEQQLTPEKKASAQSTEDPCESSSLEFLAETSGRAENRRLKRRHQDHDEDEEFWALGSARDSGPPQPARRHAEPTATSCSTAWGPGRANPGSRPGPAPRSPPPPPDTLWLQAVSNLSDWLSSDPGT